MDTTPDINFNTQATLLLFDRRDDPVTPLLHVWTYQAMIHELITIKDNRVDLGNPTLPEPEVVLSSDQDEFFRKIMHKNFAEVADDIHNHVQQYL